MGQETILKRGKSKDFPPVLFSNIKTRLFIPERFSRFDFFRLVKGSFLCYTVFGLS